MQLAENLAHIGNKILIGSIAILSKRRINGIVFDIEKYPIQQSIKWLADPLTRTK
ncbi:hypothetical protein APR08_004592 [Nocardia amikacinitolerans]|nr:hypothetical protein [Nocardia amikacinitolerans]